MTSHHRTGAADHYSEVHYSFFTRLMRQLSVVPKLHSLCTRWDHHQCAGMNCSAHIWRTNKCMEADWHTETFFFFSTAIISQPNFYLPGNNRKGMRAIGPAYQLPINTNANVTFSIEVKLWMGFKFNSWRSWHLFFQLIRACSSHSECSVG